jgi:hypothetical protein
MKASIERCRNDECGKVLLSRYSDELSITTYGEMNALSTCATLHARR